MLKIVRYTVILLILTLVLNMSCSETPETETPQKSFIWEVTSDDTSVYILGSIHVADADLYPLDKAIEDSYKVSQNIVVEININDSENLQKTQRLLMEKGMYPSGENLEDHITVELYEKLEKRLKELDSSGLFLYSLKMFEPWVVALSISDLEYMELGYDAEYGIDMYFLDKAEADGKNILELETVEFQLDIFDGLPDELQITMLEDTIDNPATKEELEELFDAWCTGDTTTMEQILFEESEGDEEYDFLQERLIDERNFQMTEKIEDYLEDDEVYFVVVGAGHLVGDNGIIKLLIEKGYKVSQL
jgi:uncharacterized protein YbaP (TraB family)